MLILRKPHKRLRDTRNISAYDSRNVPDITQTYTRLIKDVHYLLSRNLASENGLGADVVAEASAVQPADIQAQS